MCEDDDEKFRLLLRKVVYPYEIWMGGIDLMESNFLLEINSTAN